MLLNMSNAEAFFMDTCREYVDVDHTQIELTSLLLLCLQ